MADPTLYLFDGWNLLHAGGYGDPRELIDDLASFVGTSGARGILVFDGVGPDEKIGPLQIRFAEHADALLERLAAEHRNRELVTSSRPTASSAASPARKCGRCPRSGSSPMPIQPSTRKTARFASPTASTSARARSSSASAAASRP